MNNCSRKTSTNCIFRLGAKLHGNAGIHIETGWKRMDRKARAEMIGWKERGITVKVWVVTSGTCRNVLEHRCGHSMTAECCWLQGGFHPANVFKFVYFFSLVRILVCRGLVFGFLIYLKMRKNLNVINISEWHWLWWHDCVIAYMY